MKRTQQDLVRVSEEAATWVLRLQEEDSPQTRAEFDKWIRQGPGHLEEFYFAQMMFAELDRLDPTFELGSVDSNSSSVIEFPVPREEENPAVEVSAAPVAAPETLPSKRFGKLGWFVGIAASLVLAIGLLLAPWPLGSKTYSTGIGSQESIKLDDGSIIHLNTHSRAQVRFSERLREVRLLEGEALFTVAHDATRPFIVITESAQVRAVGTQFNVYRNGADQTRVSVLEGVVQVTTAGSPLSETPLTPSPAVGAGRGEETTEAIRLAVGDEAEVDGGRVVKAAMPDLERAVAWRARRLVFPGNPVAEIADEFNRYSTRRIRVEGEAVRSRRMTGVFDADDPAPMIRFLSRDPNVEVIRSETEILIRPRSGAAP